MNEESKTTSINETASTPKRDRLDEIKKLWYKFSLNRMSVVGLGIVLFVLILAVFQPILAPYPDHVGAVVDFQNASKAPCASYWMGTDTVGRDIMSRIFYAYRGAFTMKSDGSTHTA